jgi:hypothetical protein
VPLRGYPKNNLNANMPKNCREHYIAFLSALLYDNKITGED